MRLRRLTLHGFKTFARRSELTLEDGITAVVGPNGSGKSNLVDAIRWALGETNARELRGARMDEVIHNGGQGRPPMGMATVDLVIDNESGRLPVDDPEVEISRRVTRHGDSEYRVNGSRARLRDVERLLGATGLTQSGYSVVAQNDVDGIIDATPAQRRSLVEEAAGVRGLRAARDDTLARVASTDTRLLRLVDLLADAEPRLAELAGQTEAALEQRALTARLSELRGSLAREAWRAARAHARRTRQRLSMAQGRGEATAEAEAGFAARIESARTRLAGALAARAEAARAAEEARLVAERAAGDRRRLAEQAAAAGIQRAAARGEEEAAVAEAAAADATVAELAGAGMEASSQLDSLAERRLGLVNAQAAALAALREAERDVTGATAELEAGQWRRAEADARVREHETRAGLLDENAASLADSAAAAAQRLADLASAAAIAETRAEELEGAAQAAARRAMQARERTVAARERLAASEAEHAAAVRAAREVEARAAALRGQVEGALGGGPVASAIERGRLHGRRLLEAFRVVDPADQAAVEAALEAHLGAWLVDDLDAAAALLAAGDGGLREEVVAAGLEQAGDGGVGTVAPAPRGVRPAVAAIASDPGAEGVLDRLLAGTWLAPDLATARAATATRGRAVLPDGTVVTSSGIRGGGRPGAALALAAAEREAQRKLATARSTAAQSEVGLTEATAAATAAAADGASSAAAADAARAEVAAGTAASVAARAAARSEEERSAALLAERAAREAASAQAREAAGVAAAEAHWAAEKLLPLEQRLLAARSALDGRAATLADAEGAVRSHELAVARAEPEAREVQRRLASGRELAAQARQRARIAGVRLVAAEEAALVAVARGAAADRVAEAAEITVGEADLAAQEAAAPVPALEAHVRDLEAERAEVAVAVARAADELAAATAECDLAEGRVAELAEAVRDDEQDDGPEPDAADAEKVEREIARLERRVTALGPVNALAPEQHATLFERASSARADHDDLAGACADLRALTDHLAAEIAQRFDAVFGAVAYHFQLLFQELFPGGRATLRLQQPEPEREADLDDAAFAPRAPRAPGVEILAQPPGKRLQSLSLLSGGERALTALAVILALQQVNPSPFYVFDEVDAPLDDANIGRFTRLLTRLARTQQFLVVTHNHATMAAADALYGVTMGADGVSRMLSVRFVAGKPVPVEAVREPAAV
jgi:chromosome segregation protein